MTEQELREKYGLERTELLSTNKGLIDIFQVWRDPGTGLHKVSYGLLAKGETVTETVESFIERFKDSSPEGIFAAEKSN